MIAALLRRLLCALGKCTRCITREDRWAVWGECIDCGKRHGVVTRAELRRAFERGL